MTDRDTRPTDQPSPDPPELTDPIIVAAFEGWNAKFTQQGGEQ